MNIWNFTAYTVYVSGYNPIYSASNILVKICEGFVFYKLGNLVNIFVKCHQRKGPGGEAVRRQRGCPARQGPGVQRWIS